jgi:starvation-inducible DNA-binding protein
MIKPDIGVHERDRKRIAEGLSMLLAGTYTLYLKTQNFHWNVVGENFVALHSLFEKQYEHLADATDDIAERIRALGYFAPATYGEFSRISPIDETAGHPEATEMIRVLHENHQALTRFAHGLCEVVENAGDQATLDLLADRVRQHEKYAWMLRSLVETGAVVRTRLKAAAS